MYFTLNKISGIDEEINKVMALVEKIATLVEWVQQDANIDWKWWSSKATSDYRHAEWKLMDKIEKLSNNLKDDEFHQERLNCKYNRICWKNQEVILQSISMKNRKILFNVSILRKPAFV